jgi:hypothetical protein
MELVGGYRLVRRLGSGVRADIHLGHAGNADPPQEQRVAAIKVFRPAVSAESIETEITALTRSRSRHLLELRDLALAPNGQPCFIFPRLGSGSLARFLDRRKFISAGEAVTILVPIVEAVAELHRVGVAHGAVNAGSVLFDNRGAPVLARFGAATIVGDSPDSATGRSLIPAAEEENGRLAEDRRSLDCLIAAVLDRVEEPTGAAPAGDGTEGLVASVLDRPGLDRRGLDRPAIDRPVLDRPGLDRPALELSPLDERERNEIVAALFDLAPAAVIRFDDASDGDDAPTPIPARLTPSKPPRREPPQVSRVQINQAQGSARPSGRGRIVALRLRALAEQAAGAGIDENPIGALRTRLARSIRTVRLTVWIAGGAGLCALVAALTLIPSALSAERTPTVSPAAVGESPPPASAPASARPSAASASSRSPSSSEGPAGSGLTEEGPTKDSGAAGEDPAVAAVALIATRRACLEQRSESCLAGVDQNDSAAMDADRYLLRSLSAHADIPTDASFDGMAPGLVQRLGDTAIVQFGFAEATEPPAKANPASLLLIRSEAGWRIRDLTFG